MSRQLVLLTVVPNIVLGILRLSRIRVDPSLRRMVILPTFRTLCSVPLMRPIYTL